jgi:hypothetical protein
LSDEDAANSADAQFLVAAREDVPRLVAEVERLRAEAMRFRALLARVVADDPLWYGPAYAGIYGADDGYHCLYCGWHGADTPPAHDPGCVITQAGAALESPR